MALRGEDLSKMFERLNETDKETVYTFIQFLIERSEKKPLPWKKIDQAEPDNEPLNQEELQQLCSEEEYVSWEQARRELKV